MKKKVLFTAKVDSHIKHFHLPFLKLFKDNGYEVHVASEGSMLFENCDVKYNVSYGVNPFSKDVIDSYKALKQIISENEFDVIHTHTAIASVLTRLVAHKINKRRKLKSRIMYTAHGFHFLKGGSKLSWIIYYPIERYVARYTDDLILINKEDFDLATRKKMGKNRHYVPGVGIDLSKFTQKVNFDNTKKIITYVAELSVNKNQILLLKAAELLKNTREDFEVQLIGDGDNRPMLEEYIEEHKLGNYVKLLGYRDDVANLLSNSNVAVSTSLREGLPINIVESMATGLPVIVTRCRGHVDLIEDGVNGYIVDYDAGMVAYRLNALLNDSVMADKFSKINIERSKQYSVSTILKTMASIYGLEQQ